MGPRFTMIALSDHHVGFGSIHLYCPTLHTVRDHTCASISCAHPDSDYFPVYLALVWAHLLSAMLICRFSSAFCQRHCIATFHGFSLLLVTFACQLALLKTTLLANTFHHHHTSSASSVYSSFFRSPFQWFSQLRATL